MRYQWKPEGRRCIVCIKDVEREYSYEYLGCTSRLVITTSSTVATSHLLKRSVYQRVVLLLVLWVQARRRLSRIWRRHSVFIVSSSTAQIRSTIRLSAVFSMVSHKQAAEVTSMSPTVSSSTFSLSPPNKLRQSSTPAERDRESSSSHTVQWSNSTTALPSSS